MELDRLLHDIEEEVKAITLTQHNNGNDIQGFNGNLVKKRLKNQKGDLSFHTVLDSTVSTDCIDCMDYYITMNKSYVFS